MSRLQVFAHAVSLARPQLQGLRGDFTLTLQISAYSEEGPKHMVSEDPGRQLLLPSMSSLRPILLLLLSVCFFAEHIPNLYCILFILLFINSKTKQISSIKVQSPNIGGGGSAILAYRGGCTMIGFFNEQMSLTRKIEKGWIGKGRKQSEERELFSISPPCGYPMTLCYP